MEHTVRIAELETGGMPAKHEELHVGTEVIWVHKNKKSYAAEIVELLDGHCIPASKKRRISKSMLFLVFSL